MIWLGHDVERGYRNRVPLGPYLESASPIWSDAAWRSSLLRTCR